MAKQLYYIDADGKLCKNELDQKLNGWFTVKLDAYSSTGVDEGKSSFGGNSFGSLTKSECIAKYTASLESQISEKDKEIAMLKAEIKRAAEMKVQ